MKAKLVAPFAGIVPVICFFFAMPALADVNTGLVAYYPFNGNASDASGNNHNGGLQGNVSAAADRFGDPNGALRFDGNGDYVSIPDSSSWNFGINDFTVVFRVNFSAVKRTMLIGQSDGPGQDTNKWFIEYGGASWPSNRLHFHINSLTLPELYPVVVPFTPIASAWYHIAVTRSGNTYSIYTNAVFGASAVDLNAVPNPSHSLTIGQVEFTAGEAGYYMNGLMDDVRIYNRALSASEVQQL